MKKWEYRVIHTDGIKLNEQISAEEYWLKRLGKLGWELVSVIPGKGLTNSWSHLYFKRPTK